MNIVFVDAVQDFGGSQKSTIELINNLKSQHSCLFIDFWGVSEGLIRSLEESKVNYRILNQRDQPIVIGAGGLSAKLLNGLMFFADSIKCKKIIQQIFIEFKPDVVIVNNLKSLSVLNLSRKSYKIILFERTWFAQKKINLFQRILYSRIDNFFAVSNATKNAIFAKGLSRLSRIFYIPNYSSINIIRNSSRTIKKLSILNAGGYLKTKGLHVSLEIAKNLKERNIEFEMNIVGVVYNSVSSRNYYEYLENLLANYKLEDYVFLHKDITDMSFFYEKSDILIHPTYTEGLPRVVMESMAYGIPVIANPVGGVNDYIINGITGILPTFNCVDEFAENIIELKNNRFLYSFIVENSHCLIKSNFTKENQIHKLNQALEIITNDNNSDSLL